MRGSLLDRDASTTRDACRTVNVGPASTAETLIPAAPAPTVPRHPVAVGTRLVRSALGSAAEQVLVELTAMLAADLELLTAALDDPAMDASTDTAQTVLGFDTNTRVAVASFLGVTITITAHRRSG